MLIVITGLDGSGTSSVAKKLHELDEGSILLKTPSTAYADRINIDDVVRRDSPLAHMMYYLSSDIYISDYIKKHCDYKNKNVYLVRYLIDTVVSNRVAGIPMDLDYNVFGHSLLVPDLTIFVQLDEKTRQQRLLRRGKDSLDSLLDEELVRKQFLKEFQSLLDPKKTIYVTNKPDIDTVGKRTYKKIKQM